MSWSVLVASLALAAAAVALLSARRARQELAHLREMYWELRFDHGELKGRVKALDGGAADGPPAPPPAARPMQGFVPLGDLKKPR